MSANANSCYTNQHTSQLHHNKIGDLDTFTIHGNGFCAVVLKQGAQLIHFFTEDNDRFASDDSTLGNNWLWVSEQAEYNQGESVRGGVPICWPVFGQFDANPPAVKDSFADVANMNAMPQHGYARLQPFELDSFSVDDTDVNGTQTTTLILTLDSNKLEDKFASAPSLALKAVLTFSATGFSIELVTQNNSDKAVTFSQALHTYLPTDDITQTRINGFDKITYSDALTIDADTGGWQTKTQQGDITFNSEVDRVYHAAPDIILDTPSHRYSLVATGSHSTVIWNPWIDKSKQVSQFADDDYQRMLCIETANAHLDVVTLGVGEVHSLSVKIQRDKYHET